MAHDQNCQICVDANGRLVVKIFEGLFNADNTGLTDATIVSATYMDDNSPFPLADLDTLDCKESAVTAAGGSRSSFAVNGPVLNADGSRTYTLIHGDGSGIVEDYDIVIPASTGTGGGGPVTIDDVPTSTDKGIPHNTDYLINGPSGLIYHSPALTTVKLSEFMAQTGTVEGGALDAAAKAMLLEIYADSGKYGEVIFDCCGTIDNFGLWNLDDNCNEVKGPREFRVTASEVCSADGWFFGGKPLLSGDPKTQECKRLDGTILTRTEECSERWFFPPGIDIRRGDFITIRTDWEITPEVQQGMCTQIEAYNPATGEALVNTPNPLDIEPGFGFSVHPLGRGIRIDMGIGVSWAGPDNAKTAQWWSDTHPRMGIQIFNVEDWALYGHTEGGGTGGYAATFHVDGDVNFGWNGIDTTGERGYGESLGAGLRAHRVLRMHGGRHHTDTIFLQGNSGAPLPAGILGYGGPQNCHVDLISTGTNIDFVGEPEAAGSPTLADVVSTHGGGGWSTIRATVTQVSQDNPQNLSSPDFAGTAAGWDPFALGPLSTFTNSRNRVAILRDGFYDVSISSWGGRQGIEVFAPNNTIHDTRLRGCGVDTAIRAEPTWGINLKVLNTYVENYANGLIGGNNTKANGFVTENVTTRATGLAQDTNGAAW